MGKYTPERREEEFRLLRERMERRAGMACGAPPLKAPTLATYRRAERMKTELPAHLKMYRVNEVAALLGVSRKTVERWFRERGVWVGEPRAGRRLKRTLLISLKVLEDWLSEKRAQAS